MRTQTMNQEDQPVMIFVANMLVPRSRLALIFSRTGNRLYMRHWIVKPTETRNWVNAQVVVQPNR